MGVARFARCARWARFATLVLTVALLAPVEGQARNFLWKAAGRQNTIYLVGSVHMLTKDYYPLSPVLDAAFKDSTLLVEEADLGEMLSPESQLALLGRVMLPPAQSLDALVSPATFALVGRHAAALGVPMEPLKRFKPWYVALTLLGLEWQKAGFDSELGLDRHFYDRAKSEGKDVQGLETAAYQMSRFDEMTPAQQDHLLAESLKDLAGEQASVTTLANAWRAGDGAAVERIVFEGVKDDPLLYQRLLVERNRNWLPRLEALFARQGHAFVVVGAAHLVGPDGLLAMLKARGFSVEQM